jgi:hypothetical protein
LKDALDITRKVNPRLAPKQIPTLSSCPCPRLNCSRPNSEQHTHCDAFGFSTWPGHGAGRHREFIPISKGRELAFAVVEGCRRGCEGPMPGSKWWKDLYPNSVPCAFWGGSSTGLSEGSAAPLLAVLTFALL